MVNVGFDLVAGAGDDRDGRILAEVMVDRDRALVREGLLVMLVATRAGWTRRPLSACRDDSDDLVLDNDRLYLVGDDDAHTVSCRESRTLPWMSRVLSVFGLVSFRS